MRAFKVHNCYVEGGTSWSGTVIARDDETVSDAIKRKFGVEYLYGEKYYDEKVKANEVNADIINVKDLSVGELKIVVESIIANKN